MKFDDLIHFQKSKYYMSVTSKYISVYSSSFLDPNFPPPAIHLLLDGPPASQIQNTQTLTNYLFPPRAIPLWA